MKSVISKGASFILKFHETNGSQQRSLGLGKVLSVGIPRKFNFERAVTTSLLRRSTYNHTPSGTPQLTKRSNGDVVTLSLMYNQCDVTAAAGHNCVTHKEQLRRRSDVIRVIILRTIVADGVVNVLVGRHCVK